MLSRFLKARSNASRVDSSIPVGERVYAIGDVHGCDALLADLLALIDQDDAARAPAATTIVMIGDLVDRGPESAAVVDRLLRMTQQGRAMRFLKGNHEEVFLHAVDGDAKALRLFCRIGGRETVLSYGLEPGVYEALDYDGIARALDRLVPAEHRAFLNGFEDVVVIGDYAFVHAGIRPAAALEDQSPRDLRWIRDTFLDHRGPFPKRIVHGHSIVPEVEIRAHRIAIDTGAYESGRLSAIGLENGSVWQLQT